MKTQKIYHSDVAFLDLLFCTLVGFVFLFICAFLLITTEKKKADIKTKAEFIITLTWADSNESDVDVWLEDPLGNVLYFSAKEVGLMHLDRDDLGRLNDRITLKDGTWVSYNHNQEIVTIRGFIPGEWVLNVHLYRMDGKEPVPVEIKMDKLNPYETIIYKRFMINKDWDEITIKRFTMTNDGSIISMNELPKKLVESKSIPTPDMSRPN